MSTVDERRAAMRARVAAEDMAATQARIATMERAVEVVSGPADSFTRAEKAITDSSGSVYDVYTVSWGKIANPNRVTITVITEHEPAPDGYDKGRWVVYYDPSNYAVTMANGEQLILRTKATLRQWRSFSFIEEKPTLVDNLACPLRSQLALLRSTAPSVAGA